MTGIRSTISTRAPAPIGNASAPAGMPRARAGLLQRWLSARWSAWTSPLILLLLWCCATALGWAPEQILASPARVLGAARELVDSGELQQHLWLSLYRLLSGFAIGCASGITFGLMLGLAPRLRPYFAPTFNVLRQLPSVALIPLFILLFGIGESFKVLIVVKATFFVVALAVEQAIHALGTQYLEVAAVFRFTRWQTIRKVVLPAIVPDTLTGARIALSRSWMVLVGAELLAADSGIGQMMEMGRQMFRLDIVMLGVLLTGSIGFLLDRGCRLMQARLMRWKGQA